MYLYAYAYVYLYAYAYTHTYYTHTIMRLCFFACISYISAQYPHKHSQTLTHSFPIPTPIHTHSLPLVHRLRDTQTDMPRRGASCVQKLNDSQIHANRTTYRTLLRSSSLQEPRDPLLKVVFIFFKLFNQSLCQTLKRKHQTPNKGSPC